jgi:hypothetical protein
MGQPFVALKAARRLYTAESTVVAAANKRTGEVSVTKLPARFGLPLGGTSSVNLVDELHLRRSVRRQLDDRIAAAGLKVAHRHAEGCEVGLRPRAPCTCRQVVNAREARRPQRRRFLYR